MSECITPRDSVHGFTANRSVVTNAKTHLCANLILNIDLVDFFPTFHFGRVKGVFKSNPYNFPDKVATVLAQTCCFQARLPQGAPTSPMISNIICRRLDRDFARLAKNRGCRYTRYADDITFSTDGSSFPLSLVATPSGLQNPTPMLGPDILAILAKHSMTLNPKKCRMRRKSERQEVTGIIVNEKINVCRAFIRNIRSILHDCDLNGITAANQKFHRIDKKARLGGTPDVVKHVRGKLDYLKMVRGHDDRIYTRLAIRAEKIAPTKTYGIPTFGRSVADSKLLAESVWVVLGFDHDHIQVSQGTAFTLTGVGIVSAYHVFKKGKEEGAVRWALLNAANPHKSHAITGYRGDERVDLAVIESQASTPTALLPGTKDPQVNDNVRIVGFPYWHTLGDRMFEASTKVLQTKILSTIMHIFTGGPVRGGNSGGPLLSDEGYVVGVALWDGTSFVAPDGGVAIKHIGIAAAAPHQAV